MLRVGNVAEHVYGTRVVGRVLVGVGLGVGDDAPELAHGAQAHLHLLTGRPAIGDQASKYFKINTSSSSRLCFFLYVNLI